MTLGKKLQLLRKARGMSQEQLAEELGVSRQAVSKWELDATLPDTANVIALGKIFGVTTDYLLVEDAAAKPVYDVSRKERNPKVIVGAIMGVFGALGWFLAYIVSRFTEVMIPYTYRDEFGEVWTTYDSTRTDVNFALFIEEYHLKGLLVALAVLSVIGIILVCWDKYIEKLIKRA